MATSRHERNARYKGDRGASGIDGMPDYPGNSGRQKRSWRKRTTRTLSAKSGLSGPAGDISIPRYPVRLGLIYLFTFFLSIFLFADDFHRCDDDDVSPFRLLFAYFRRRMVPLKKRYPQSIEMVVRVVYAFPHSFRVV